MCVPGVPHVVRCKPDYTHIVMASSQCTLDEISYLFRSKTTFMACFYLDVLQKALQGFTLTACGPIWGSVLKDTSTWTLEDLGYGQHQSSLGTFSSTVNVREGSAAHSCVDWATASHSLTCDPQACTVMSKVKLSGVQYLAQGHREVGFELSQSALTLNHS